MNAPEEPTPDLAALRPAGVRVGAVIDQLRAAVRDRGAGGLRLRGALHRSGDEVLMVGAALQLRSAVLRLRTSELRRQSARLLEQSRSARAKSRHLTRVAGPKCLEAAYPGSALPRAASSLAS